MSRRTENRLKKKPRYRRRRWTLENDFATTQEITGKNSKPRKANVDLQLIFIVQIDGR